MIALSSSGARSSPEGSKRHGYLLQRAPSLLTPVPRARETRLWQLPETRANALRATLTLTGLDSPVA
ncbi:hypothetical protein V5G28_031515 [Scytonema sp. PRP1]